MTQLGEEGEFKVVEHVLKQFPEGIVSVVGDSYHIFNHAKTLGTRFKDIILARNGVYVVRPDSGDPEETTLKLITILGDLFGYTYNSKSYKVLNPKVRIIWGDGIDKRGIENVLGILRINGWSAENMVFGMGGGLLQKINRDTQRFAFKSSAQYRDGVWVDVYKKPIDTTKASKRGFLKLTKNQQGIFETIRAGSFDDLENNYLVPVFLNGDLLLDQTFDQLRENAKV